MNIKIGILNVPKNGNKHDLIHFITNRNMLWHKLEKLGLHENLFNAIKSIYNTVLCSVKLNWIFDRLVCRKCGLKQGCSLSPVLFNLYINDLALKLNALGKGIRIHAEFVFMLLYADDIVLLAKLRLIYRLCLVY